MEHAVATEGDAVRLSLKGHLVHEDRGRFERVIDDVLATRPGAVKVDFGALDYMDSAGLGFLLTLRERAEAKRVSVSLLNSKGAVRELLELARFDTLFSIRADG